VKIAEIRTYQLKAPLGKERFYSSQAAFPERTSFLVEVISSDGRSGWGEGGQWGPTEPVAAVMEHIFAPRLKGRSVHDVVPRTLPGGDPISKP
jgi:D-galactarolactone cycloisomerase